jgi:hypothetical protein
VSIGLVVSIAWPITVESFQPIQLEVEPVQIENPQISRFQLVLVCGHYTETLRQIRIFLEQVTQNATTWSGTLQELSNLIIEFEQVKENMFETHNHLQTCSLKLKTMQRTLKNRDKDNNWS